MGEKIIMVEIVSSQMSIVYQKLEQMTSWFHVSLGSTPFAKKLVDSIATSSSHKSHEGWNLTCDRVTTSMIAVVVAMVWSFWICSNWFMYVVVLMFPMSINGGSTSVNHGGGWLPSACLFRCVHNVWNDFGGTWLSPSSLLKLIPTFGVDMYSTSLDQNCTNFLGSPSIVSSFQIFTLLW